MEEARVRDVHGVRAQDGGRLAAAKRRDGKRHRESMIPGRVRGPAAQGAPAVDVKAIGQFVGVGAKGAKSRDQRRYPIALLTRSSDAPVTVTSPP